MGCVVDQRFLINLLHLKKEFYWLIIETEVGATVVGALNETQVSI